MLPQIQIFGKDIGTYALLGVIGVLVAGFLFCRLTRKRGYADTDALWTLLFAGAGSLVGSHVLYALTHVRLWPRLLSVSSLEELWVLGGFLLGGSVFYGGLIGGAAAAYLWLKIGKRNVALYADNAAVCVPLFHAFARVGCFLAGCCYGVESEWGFASSYNPLVPDVVGVRRFPIQLVEACGNLLLFLVLLWLWRRASQKERWQGRLFFVYLTFYAAMRFLLELWRGDTIRGIWFGLSTSQWISLLLFFVSVTVLIRDALREGRTKNKRTA